VLLAKNTALRENMGRRSRQLAKAEFCIERQNHQLERIYDKIVTVGSA